MFNKTRIGSRHAASVLAMVVALSGGYAQAVLAEVQTVSFNIPAETTAQALMDFSRQAGLQILFPYDLAAGHRTPAISGQFTREAVLSRLLEGTGLEVAEQTPTSITLRPKVAPSAKPSSPQASDSTEVVVTGSHIRGGNPTSPVHTLTRGDIDQSGYSQAGDLVRSLPENFSGGQNPGVIVNTVESNANISNASTVNLRGLGPDATLTLLNGKRLATDSVSSNAPDISVIPVEALQRVEVVTDGASALYGSDAVAGVVNFITRKDYSGLDVATTGGVSTQGGGAEQDLSVLAGTTWQTGHVMMGSEYFHQDPILASQRAFTSQAMPANALLIANQKRSIFWNGEQDLSDRLSIHVDGLYADRKAGGTVQYSTDDPGETTENEVRSYVVSPGLTARLGGDWQASIDGTVTRSSEDTIGYYGTDFDYTDHTRSSFQTVEATGSGTLFDMPSGKLKAAIGAGYRRESQRYWSADETRIGSHDVRYIYGELLAPLVSPSTTRTGLHELQLSLAGRAENYSDFGRTTTPKVGLRYVPFDELTVRATWGKSFKVPSFTQRLTPTIITLWKSSNLGGPAGSTAMFEFGGNPALKPERSTSWTTGIDWTPGFDSGFRFSATYFDIDYTDRVVSPIPSTLTALSDPANAPYEVQAPTAAQQAALIASVSRFSNISGSTYDPTKVLAVVNATYVNAAAQTTKGVDLSVRQKLDLPKGRLELFANGTWSQLTQQLTPTQDSVTLSGYIFETPKARTRSGATWHFEAVTATAIVNYTSAEIDNAVSPDAKVASWTTLDLNFAYALPTSKGPLSGFEASLAITNALDKKPSFAQGANVGFPGIYYDSTTMSPIGRYVALNLRKKL